MLILLHSSKTMRPLSADAPVSIAAPLLADQASTLASYLTTLSPDHIQKVMKISQAKAQETHELIQSFSDSNQTRPALDSFLGDIYSGLQSHTFTREDREYAHKHLYILSGLYGVLRALDGIRPYRLEMGYKLPGNSHDAAQPNITSMYEFWGDAIARQLPKHQPIINLSAVEYTKAIFPHFKHIEGLKDTLVISPKFLTVSPKTGVPTFVTVHAKIARGAFAGWLIRHRIEDTAALKTFNEIGYVYSNELSTEFEPVFVAGTFKGLGLSVRQKKSK